MRILLTDVGKRYRREWTFRGLQLDISTPHRLAVRGPNGAGKSTFLRICSGILSPSSGEVQWFIDGQNIPGREVYRYLAYAAPYQELIDNFTAEELVLFHTRFKKMLLPATSKAILSRVQLVRARRTFIRDFSSGMLQRLKLGLAILSDTPFLILDEPTTNLDVEGMAWYKDMLEEYGQGKLILIASNEERDFIHCDQQIVIGKTS